MTAILEVDALIHALHVGVQVDFRTEPLVASLKSLHIAQNQVENRIGLLGIGFSGKLTPHAADAPILMPHAEVLRAAVFPGAGREHPARYVHIVGVHQVAEGNVPGKQIGRFIAKKLFHTLAHREDDLAFLEQFKAEYSFHHGPNPRRQMSVGRWCLNPGQEARNAAKLCVSGPVDGVPAEDPGWASSVAGIAFTLRATLRASAELVPPPRESTGAPNSRHAATAAITSSVSLGTTSPIGTWR